MCFPPGTTGPPKRDVPLWFWVWAWWEKEFSPSHRQRWRTASACICESCKIPTLSFTNQKRSSLILFVFRMNRELLIAVDWMTALRSASLGPSPGMALLAAVVITAVQPIPTHPFLTNLIQVSFCPLLYKLYRPKHDPFHALASTSCILLLSRLCWLGQPGYDLLSQQPSADTVHDSRIQKRTLQVSNQGFLWNYSWSHSSRIDVFIFLLIPLAHFSWEFEESEEDPVTSIPYQLQRLFVLLQTSKKRAIETTDVTRSFGWDSSEGEGWHTSIISTHACGQMRHMSLQLQL